MRKCCECNKRVWPWQQSKLAISIIHATCHKRKITEWLSKEPNGIPLAMREIMESSAKYPSIAADWGIALDAIREVRQKGPAGMKATNPTGPTATIQ
jgi:hypothetical protein